VHQLGILYRTNFALARNLTPSSTDKSALALALAMAHHDHHIGQAQRMT
jgi:hypothetical protein